MSGRAMVLGVMPSNHWTRYPVRGAHGLGVSTISWPGAYPGMGGYAWGAHAYAGRRGARMATRTLGPGCAGHIVPMAWAYAHIGAHRRRPVWAGLLWDRGL